MICEGLMIHVYFHWIIFFIGIFRNLISTRLTKCIYNKQTSIWLFYFIIFGFFFPDFIYLFIFCFTILYWFCHTSTWIRHGCTHVPNPESPSHLPPHTISLGHPSAPAPSILYPAVNLDWKFISYMILYMFQCHSPKILKFFQLILFQAQ